MLILNSFLFGIGLAVDAFLVALANGVNCPSMSKPKVVGVAAAFSAFQLAAPMIGWVIAHTAFSYFGQIEIYFSWAAVAVLVFLGVKMIVESYKKPSATSEQEQTHIGKAALFAQCAATSVDALTVGFTIEEYGALSALLCSAIIAAVTFAAYIAGVAIGKRFGMRFHTAATVIGGIAFIAMAAEIITTTYI